MMENMDLCSAEFGRRLSDIKDIGEKLLQDALSVLEEQGLCAFFLYLDAHGKKPGKQVKETCCQFVGEHPVLKSRVSASTSDVFEMVNKLSEDIDDLLFARELLMQALVYARYHVKAK